MLSKAINNEDGFSLIEILVVIVIIGILAAIAIPMYVNHQRAAKTAASISSVKQLREAIDVARIKSGKTLMQITGSNCTRCSFSVDPLQLPSNNTGWVAYKNSLAKISDASGVDVKNLLDGYGRPIFMDENEGENGNCVKDSIGVWGDPWDNNMGNSVAISFSSAACTT